MSSPRVIDLQRAKKAISYLAGSSEYCLVFNANDKEEILGWADSSFKSGEGDRRNRYGYCFQLERTSGMLVAVSKRSTLLAQSSTEAEFYSLAEACRELLWIRSFLQKILEEIPCGIVFQDNTSTINVVSHEDVSEWTKHIDVKFHFVIKLKSSGEAELLTYLTLTLTLTLTSSPEMCADAFITELSDDVYPKHAQIMQELFKIT